MHFEFYTAPTDPIIAVSLTPHEGQLKYFPREISVVGSYLKVQDWQGAVAEGADADACGPSAPEQASDGNIDTDGPTTDGPASWSPGSAACPNGEFWTSKLLVTQAGTTGGSA
eukprot:SAG31_NODE_19658_length_595_cov_0.941532_2_plen_112_part_01